LTLREVAGILRLASERRRGRCADVWEGSEAMEAMLETVEQPVVVVEEQETEAVLPQPVEEATESEELVELLLKEITIDGMCGVY